MTPARLIVEAHKMALRLESDLQALSELRGNPAASYAILADIDLFTLRQLSQYLAELAGHYRVEINKQQRAKNRRAEKKGRR